MIKLLIAATLVLGGGLGVSKCTINNTSSAMPIEVIR